MIQAAPHHLNHDPRTRSKTLITLDQFKYSAPKADGVTQGGVYLDEINHPWMIKTPQMERLSMGVKEYVAGGLYQAFLGPYAPRTELVYDSQASKVFVGSCYLENFKTLNDWYETHPDIYFGLPKTLLGKPVDNVAQVLSAAIFMEDRDIHSGNLGLIEHDHHWSLAKIDHSFAFSGSVFAEAVTLNNYKMHLQSLDGGSIQSLGYENLYQSIKMFVDLDLDFVNAMVQTRIEAAQDYLETFDADHAMDTAIELPVLQEEIIQKMAQSQTHFKNMLQDLSLDDVLYRNDVESLEHLIEQGVDLSKPITPFYDDSSIFGVSKTPLSLAEHYQSDEVLNYLQSLDIPPPEPSPNELNDYFVASGPIIDLEWH